MLMPWTHKTSNKHNYYWLNLDFCISYLYKNSPPKRKRKKKKQENSLLREVAGRFYHFWQSNVQKKAFDGSFTGCNARLITIYTYCVIRWWNMHRSSWVQWILERQHSAKTPQRGEVPSRADCWAMKTLWDDTTYTHKSYKSVRWSGNVEQATLLETSVISLQLGAFDRQGARIRKRNPSPESTQRNNHIPIVWHRLCSRSDVKKNDVRMSDGG